VQRSTIPEVGSWNVERVCFLGRVKAERLAEYQARHERVWPDQGFKRVGEIFHVD
jgi:hypothetical protein